MKKAFRSVLETLQSNLIHVEVREHYGDCERAQRNQIVLGSGDALDATLTGITINWKGTPFQSNSEFIARIDEVTVSAWHDRLADAAGLQSVAVGVEDLAPDTCLSFIFLYARLNGADAADFPAQWVDYANRWEQGDVKTTGKPMESWGCLLSALGHSYWQRAPAAGDAQAPLNRVQLKSGFLACVRFTLGLLLGGCQPERIAYADAASLDEFHQARALVDYEQKVYLQALQHAELLQLLMPLRNSGRTALVDVFMVSDLALSGTIKSFIRNDSEHPWIGTGFPLMLLHRPSELGTGNDITISVDPSSRITLKPLHREIEALENERWHSAGKNRPNDRPRHGYACNEPWYLEPTHESLIGAPHWLVKGEQHGSELAWDDVVSVLWRLCNPARDLQVTELRRLPAQEKGVAAASSSGLVAGPRKQLLAVKWVADGIEQSIVLSPTMKRYLMTTALCSDAQREEIGVNNLASEMSFDFIALPGGFALIHREGSFLMDDSSREDLAVDSYVREFEQADTRCRVLAQVGQALYDQSALLSALSSPNPARALNREDLKTLHALVAQRSLLMTTMLETTPRVTDMHAVIFREMLEKRYGIASQLEQYYALLGDLEARLKRDADAASHKVQIGLARIQDRARMSAEKTQAVVSGFAAFIVVMAIWHEVEKLHLMEWLKPHALWSPLLPALSAVVLGGMVFYVQRNKAKLPAHAEAHHEEEQEWEHVATETAMHTLSQQHERPPAREHGSAGSPTAGH